MLSRERVKENSLLFKKLLQILMLLYGIHINSKETKRVRTKLKRFLVFFSFLICHLAFILSFKEAFDLEMYEKKVLIKILLFGNFATLNNIIMWYSLYLKRHKLLELLSGVSRISDRMNVRLSVRLPKFCIAYLFFYFLFTALITGHEVYNDMLVKDSFSEAMAAMLTDASMSMGVVTFYLTIFCCFYICLCSALHSVSKKLLRSVNHVTLDLTPQAAKKINGRYRETLNILRKAEEILSPPVLFLLMSTFIFIFFGFYFCLIVGVIPLAIIIFAFVQSMINFVMLFYFTIAIHEMDKKMKEVLKNFVERPELLRQYDEHVESLKLKVYENPFCFSAWGFFQFTKIFFVSALGSCLTYMLLVTQL